jgi:hypothetical protein
MPSRPSGNFSATFPKAHARYQALRVLNALEVRFAVDTLVAAVGLLGLELQLPNEPGSFHQVADDGNRRT